MGSGGRATTTATIAPNLADVSRAMRCNTRAGTAGAGGTADAPDAAMGFARPRPAGVRTNADIVIVRDDASARRRRGDG